MCIFLAKKFLAPTIIHQMCLENPSSARRWYVRKSGARYPICPGKFDPNNSSIVRDKGSVCDVTSGTPCGQLYGVGIQITGSVGLFYATIANRVSLLSTNRKRGSVGAAWDRIDTSNLHIAMPWAKIGKYSCEFDIILLSCESESIFISNTFLIPNSRGGL